MPLMSCNLQRAETAPTCHDCRDETDLQPYPVAMGNYLPYALTANTLPPGELGLPLLNESHQVWPLV